MEEVIEATTPSTSSAFSTNLTHGALSISFGVNADTVDMNLASGTSISTRSRTKRSTLKRTKFKTASAAAAQAAIYMAAITDELPACTLSLPEAEVQYLRQGKAASLQLVALKHRLLL